MAAHTKPMAADMRMGAERVRSKSQPRRQSDLGRLLARLAATAKGTNVVAELRLEGDGLHNTALDALAGVRDVAWCSAIVAALTRFGGLLICELVRLIRIASRAVGPDSSVGFVIASLPSVAALNALIPTGDAWRGARLGFPGAGQTI